MNPDAPKIGFDRFIELDWAAMALRVRAGLADEQQFSQLLDATHPGLAAKKKTRTVLNRLWLEPRGELKSLADRGVELYLRSRDDSAVLCWGMALAAYPFFATVAEIVGRLTALQGDCAAAEVHRRMAEIFGEREGTRRMTNMVLQSQASWGGAERATNVKRLQRTRRRSIANQELVAWLVEACLHHAHRPLPVVGLEANPAIYPFELASSLPYILSRSKYLEVRNEGSGRQTVSLV